MAEPRRFEGPVLEDLLRQVQVELGDGARIVSASRVRTGGLAGFFSKERFEVIAVPGAAPARLASRSRVLAARTAARPTPSAAVAPAPAPAVVPVATPAPAPVHALTSAESLLDMADAVSAMERRSAAPAADTFESVLRRAVKTVERAPLPAEESAEAAAPSAPKPRLTPRAVPVAKSAAPSAPKPAAQLHLELEPEAQSVAIPATTLDVDHSPAAAPVRGVVAVVGQLDAAMSAAHEMALVLGRDSVVVASAHCPGPEVPPWLWLPDASAARDRRERWARRLTPTVVAVDAADPVMARAVLDALEPTKVRVLGAGSAAPVQRRELALEGKV